MLLSVLKLAGRDMKFRACSFKQDIYVLCTYFHGFKYLYILGWGGVQGQVKGSG